MTDYALNEIHPQPEVWQQILEWCERSFHFWVYIIFRLAAQKAGSRGARE